MAVPYQLALDPLHHIPSDVWFGSALKVWNGVSAEDEPVGTGAWAADLEIICR